MTCSCCRQLSPFHFADFPRPSIFLQDTMNKGAHTGKTMSQIATESVDRFALRTGRSSGAVLGISKAADRRVKYGIATGKAVRLAVYRKEAV